MMAMTSFMVSSFAYVSSDCRLRCNKRAAFPTHEDAGGSVRKTLFRKENLARADAA
jgi:hypothetical protein